VVECQTVVSRRALLGGVAALAVTSGAARADAPRSGVPKDLEVRDLVVPGDRSRRLTLLVPTHLAPGQKVPLLILLHGLGETIDERMGAFAWVERYGLGTAYDRLRRPPLVRTSERDDWGPGRLDELNALLAMRPFRGLVIACPFTPDLPIGAPGVLDGFARWLVEVVAARARSEAPVLDGPEHTMLGGCSLGGHFSLEMFLRRTEDFACWAGVQTAIQEAMAPRYAERLEAALARAGPRAIHIETSAGDPFRPANEALARELDRRGIAHDFVIRPGPHDQAWLRESGSVEMLLWHDERPRVDPRVARAL
jgi:hypothetical protein